MKGQVQDFRLIFFQDGKCKNWPPLEVIFQINMGQHIPKVTANWSCHYFVAQLAIQLVHLLLIFTLLAQELWTAGRRRFSGPGLAV